ncbi:ABC transporter ATP-binding protein [Herbaspirillum sp. YR522]|uniref:ABC transporter ATP-binding protein n=1 Tax=Herbaspirillum sp. YR522 TaxID=1144342 RepID=UPI00026FCDDB|nr:ATP-binding cassette domain-containing protein [Herbaspirillum sp. YR522]EJM95632.1 ATPase component of various ABC-type transport systems with duplicated ATPase domain [Herbaspirillum sp. YR522]
MNALRLDELSVWHGQSALVRNVSLQIAQGGVLTLLGESGSGKSLLAQAIMGKLPRGLRCEGRITIAGDTTEAAHQQRRHAAWGRQVALLPQEPWLALDPTMKAWRQVAETYELVSQPAAGRQDDTLRQARERARTLAMRALHELGLADAADKYPFMISGGMAQRLAFLATHATGAPLMIIDEPTKGLDRARRADLLALLQAARRDGMSLLCITHDVWLARALGGQVAVMLDGCMIESGPAAEVLAAPQRQYTRRLLAADPERWPATPPPVTADTTPVVEISKLSKSFGARQLFAGIDARIGRGEVVAISGPSGVGKTTFGNLVLGLLEPDGGTVTRAPGLAPTAFQKLYQDPVAAFAPRLALGRSLRDLVRLHGLDWRELEQLLARMRIGPSLLDRRPGEVSGGELQRIALARALLLKPALLLADEPTSRLDPVSQQEVMQLMLAQCRQHQSAVLLVTHDPHLAARVSNRSIALR